MTILQEIQELNNKLAELKAQRVLLSDNNTEPFDFIDNDELFSIDAGIENAEARLKAIYSKATVDSLPSRWRGTKFDRGIPGCEEAEKFAKAFPNNGKGLIFHGTVGTGKTHLSAAIANYVIENHKVPVIFKSYAALLDDIRRNYDDDKMEIDRICNTPLLVIDDLGQEKQTDWQEETTFKIINSRYESMSPVVVTTNQTIMGLRDNIGEAVFSRLWEMCEWIKMNGQDYRMGGMR